MRPTSALTLALLLLAPAAQARAAGLADPGAQVFTLGGAGTLRPQEGAPASTARIPVGTPLGALADGSVAFTLPTAKTTELWRIDPQGRLHRAGTTTLGGRPIALDGPATFTPDGGLEGFDSDATALYRTTPDGAATKLATLAGDAVSLAPDGSALVVRKRTVLRVGLDGRATKLLSVPSGAYFEHAAQLADGTVVATRFSEPGLLVLRPDGTRTSADGIPTYTGGALQPLADGSVAQSDGGGTVTLSHLDAPPTVLSVSPDRPDLGDGAAPGSVALGAVSSFAQAGSGALSMSSYDGIRVILPPGVGGPVAALTPAGLGTFGTTGAATLSSRFAGTGTLDVLDGQAVVATVTGPVALGDGTLTLPQAPPKGELVQRLTVTSADGASVVVSTRSVVTLTALTLKRAKQEATTLLGSDGDEQEQVGNVLGKRKRVSPTQVDWQDITYDDTYSERGRRTSHEVRCAGVISVRLADGAITATATGARKSCRALG